MAARDEVRIRRMLRRIESSRMRRRDARTTVREELAAKSNAPQPQVARISHAQRPGQPRMARRPSPPSIPRRHGAPSTSTRALIR